jgi:hypothetical protein
MFNVNQLNSKGANEHETLSWSDAVPVALTAAVQSTYTAARCSSVVKIDQFRLIQTYDTGGGHRLYAYVRIRLTPHPCHTGQTLSHHPKRDIIIEWSPN